jgi:hypothetical protein
MPEPRHRTDGALAPRPVRARHLGLVLLVVLAAFLGPAVATSAADGPGVDTPHTAVGFHPANRTHPALTGRATRTVGDTDLTPARPLGTLPAGLLVAALLVAFVALTSRTLPTAHRTTPSFRRRGPPLLPSAG